MKMTKKELKQLLEDEKEYDEWLDDGGEDYDGEQERRDIEWEAWVEYGDDYQD